MATLLLADLNCLNKLVNGKFVIVDVSTNTYKMYYPGRYTNPVPETFNPEDYALLIRNGYSVIIDATPKMKENHLVNKLWREQNANNKELKYRELNVNTNRHNYKVGDRVHLNDKDGIYTVHEVNGDDISLTCSTWKYTDKPIRYFHISGIKCLAGGINLRKG
jgi:hypothetical protein